MNNHNRIVRKLVLWIADLFVTLVAYSTSAILRYGQVYRVPHEFQPLIILILILMSTVISLVFNLNKNFMGRGYLSELGAVILHDTLLAVSLIAVFFILHNPTAISRLVIGYFLIFSITGTYIERILIKKAVANIYKKDRFRKKLIIITDKDHSEQVKENFLTGYSYVIVGFLEADAESMTGEVDEKPVSTKAGFVPSEIVTAEFDDIFLFAPSLKRERQRQIIDEFAGMGIEVHVAVGLPIQVGQNATLSDFGFNYYCVNYSANVFEPSKMAVKRLVDIIGSIVGLILTGIIWLFLAPAIKIDSPGPVFFSQTRVGKNGKRFKIYKFRSMYQDAEARKAELMAKNQMKGLMFKMDDDPRVTKVGKFIRKTSLDEFPQFWNVLKGDMSLVGTRPPTEKEFLQYNAYYRARLTLRPGLTGLWQVSGRSDITDFDEVVRLDMQYINNWSLSGDFKILFKTIGVLFNHKGAE
ncbi:MAG: sugar transferase [Eubacteriales bacterium]|jgi:exopolysaccharide biosynthesis polyprenyl glycosylphosphotransferase